MQYNTGVTVVQDDAGIKIKDHIKSGLSQWVPPPQIPTLLKANPPPFQNLMTQFPPLICHCTLVTGNIKCALIGFFIDFPVLLG